MRLSFASKIIVCVLVSAALVAGFEIFRARRTAENTLAEERARLSENDRVAFEKTNLTPHLSQKIQIRQNVKETRDFVRFGDSYFAATGGGLAQYSDDGSLVRHFTVLDGLPESDLTALAVFDRKLFIGTRAKNLIAFDGENFAQFRWTDRKAQAVTALLADGNRLLIGTFGGGLLDFDGKNFQEIKADNQRILAVNCLFKDAGKLYVGTFNNGLWIYETAIWKHFTTVDGLPSNRVVGVASDDKNLLAATDFGLSILQENKFHTLQILPAISSLKKFDNRIYLSRDDGEIFMFDESLKEFTCEKDVSEACLTSANEKLYLLCNRGVFLFDKNKFKPFVQISDDSLTDNFVSALTIDRKGNLWAGTFRRGIDVFAEDGKKLTHLENENVWEINFLHVENETVSAATSQGFLDFKPDFSGVLKTKENNLPSNSVAHFSGGALATAKGLVFYENDKPQIISARNGLPSNSVYTILQIGKSFYAGTLGGLAQIENRCIIRVWKDSNSNLTTNWVTSLVTVNERIFIGTYGGGVFELLPSGEISSFASEIGKFVVNPNAMSSDGERLYVGTLDGAKVLDLQSQKWISVKNVLPSQTVMSIQSDAENVYFGTTGGIAQIKKNYFQNGENE